MEAIFKQSNKNTWAEKIHWVKLKDNSKMYQIEKLVILKTGFLEIHREEIETKT
jgi:hypothetical protein